jgi:hypothetical protein
MILPFSVLATEMYNEVPGRASFELDTLIGVLLLPVALAVRPEAVCTKLATQVMRPLSVALPTQPQIEGRAGRDP